MKKIIIIGGGVSGLSAGISLLKKGYLVDIYEKHSILGGNLTGWKRGDYFIDNCVHFLTGTNPTAKLYKLWTEVGAFDNVAVYNQESLYESYLDGESLYMNIDINKTLNKMLELSKEDEKQTLKFINAVKNAKKALGIYENSNEKPPNLFKKLISLYGLKEYIRLNLSDLAQKFTHPLIKKFLTDYIPGDFCALSLIFTYANFAGENAGLIEGGSIKILENIKNKFLSLGGKVYLNKTCEQVCSNKGVIKSVGFTDGTTVYGDYFIFACDIFTTYNNVLQRKLPKQILKWENLSGAHRFSSVHCCLTSTEKVEFNGTAVIEVPLEEQQIIKESRLKVKEYSYEKDFAPKGQTILQTLQFTDKITSYKWQYLRSFPYKYTTEKLKLISSYIRILENAYPNLKNKLSVIDCWTPATYHRYLGAEYGEYMSYVLPKNTIPYSINPKIKDFKNGFLATQWQSPIGGLPNALKKGLLCAKTITKLDALKQLTTFKNPFKKLAQTKNT